MVMIICVILIWIQQKSTGDKDLRCWQVYTAVYTRARVRRGLLGEWVPAREWLAYCTAASEAAWQPPDWQVPVSWMEPCYCYQSLCSMVPPNLT